MPNVTPITLLPMRGARCSTLLWRARGATFATVIVKATLQPGPRGELELVRPGDPIVEKDEHWDGDPARSLRDVSDRVPYLPRGEVLLVGSARSTGGARGVVRLVVARPGSPPLVDRRVVVRGDDAPRGQALVVPLTYENAAGGMGHAENPVGRASPLLVDPLDAAMPGSFGPRASSWPSRSRLVSPAQRSGLEGDVWHLDDVPPDYFHAAPPKQRATGFFLGDETIAIDGVTANGARIEWRLPVVRAAARVMGDPPSAMRLVADVLRIDTDQRRVSLVFRGQLPLTAGTVPSIAVSVTSASDEKLVDATVEHSGEGGGPSLPFRAGMQAPSRARSSSPVPGAPWAGGEEIPAPKASARQPQTVEISAANLRQPEVAPVRSTPPSPMIQLAPAANAPRASTFQLPPGLGSELIYALRDELARQREDR